jgi:predicted outer membrane repeat protein
MPHPTPPTSSSTPVKHSILSCLALISLPGLAQATDWTVPPGASIQVFIDVASPGDRIFVEPGTYPGGISFRGKDVEVLSIGGPEVTTIDGTGLPLPSVSCFSGETTAARLEGFTIIPGNWATGPCVRVTNGAGLTVADCTIDGSTATTGGAIYIDTATVDLEGVSISNTSATTGGAIYIDTATVDLEGVSISNTSATTGGAIYIETATVDLEGVSISNTSATNGGAIYALSSTVTGSAVTLDDCFAGGRGGGIWMQGGSLVMDALIASDCRSDQGNVVGGGAIYHEGSSVVTLTGSEFLGCIARHAGGAICSEGVGPSLTVIDSRFDGCHTLDSFGNDNGNLRYRSGGAIAFRGSGSMLVDGCEFDGNFTATNNINNSGHGGAIYATRGASTIINSEFRGNTSGGEGGAVFLGDEVGGASLAVRDCLFSENRALVWSIQVLGGRQGTSVENSVFFGNGDANANDWVVYFEPGSTPIRDCTFAYNSGRVGRRAAFTDCILWAHDGNPSECSFTHCDYEGGIGGTGNFNLDPLFVDPGAGDYNVLPSSPCIGAGVSGGDVGASLGLGVVDCNGNGITDSLELAGNDCNQNGKPDDCELNDGTSLDCNGNGLPDECDIASGFSLDCNGNGIPDECEPDCNGNGVPDDCDIASGASLDLDLDGVPDECGPDCNGNGVPDFLDILFTSPDCNGNGIPDECDLASGVSLDCNGNDIPDECEIAAGTSVDCNGNGIPDECEPDCNGNGIPDECDISIGTSLDVNVDGVPDECAPDCNGNGVPDWVDLLFSSSDCNGNGIPDECDVITNPEFDCDQDGLLDACAFGDPSFDCDGNFLLDSCEIASNPALDCDGDGVLDVCQIAVDPSLDCDGDGSFDTCQIAADPSLDCDGNGLLDACEIAADPSLDCDGDGLLDVACEIAADPSLDCDGDLALDACQIAADPSLDCNGNGQPDSCDLATGVSADCNSNGLPDECDIASGASTDCNGNGIPDECEPDCNENGIVDECDISSGTSTDCDVNGVPDECDPDCNENGIADACDIESGFSQDCNENGIPDECDIASLLSSDGDCNGVPDECQDPLSLIGSPCGISSSTGQAQFLSLAAGAEFSLDTYFLLGSLSGTSPGLPLGPDVTLPLNFVDAYFDYTVSSPNSEVLGSSFGFLSQTGEASATFKIPTSLPPSTTASLVGLTAHHAFLVFGADPVTSVQGFLFASNPVAVRLIQ